YQYLWALLSGPWPHYLFKRRCMRCFDEMNHLCRSANNAFYEAARIRLKTRLKTTYLQSLLTSRYVRNTLRPVTLCPSCKVMLLAGGIPCSEELGKASCDAVN